MSARRARSEILRAGVGGTAMAGTVDQMRGEGEEHLEGEAAGQGLVDMDAEELGGGENEVGRPGDAGEEQERTDGEDAEEDPEDGEQVRSLQVVRWLRY